ncbi:hypothetical protein [Paenarthrobacter sp. PH39-S1]|uniref:hypothetical protein n=1 Tax=Paenarthrobacter sp. PH39-S1 TaxID=3046204 RepID=UPI0024B8FF9A|nr:hypothetical protein [Paenarthrobacter sp. PH39-S1]MDJ0357951.1 hypothetical protein [Paenarthrobacter sp. PH39-S1]
MAQRYRLLALLALMAAVALGSGAVAAAPAVATAAPEGRTAHTGSTSYVDCSQPAAGTGTERLPWNSLEQVASHVFGPGDQLLFKR